MPTINNSSVCVWNWVSARPVENAEAKSSQAVNNSWKIYVRWVFAWKCINFVCVQRLNYFFIFRMSAQNYIQPWKSHTADVIRKVISHLRLFAFLTIIRHESFTCARLWSVDELQKVLGEQNLIYATQNCSWSAFFCTELDVLK